MSDGPTLAVVISCYNYEDYVESAIRSVVSQGREDCELVVVDDGSTDRSWDVISRSGVKAYRINNSGQRVACIYGLDRTRAPFVLFLDADDELKPGALAKIIGSLDPDVAKLQFPLALMDAEGHSMSRSYSSLETFRRRAELVAAVMRSGVYKSPPTSGNVFRRDLCELLRGADYDKAVDGIILFAAPLLGDVVSLSEELGRYRIHGRNDSGLGRLPDVASLDRDIKRFVARTEHLRQIARERLPEAKLVASDKAFYFRERSLCLDIASGRKPRLAALPGLLSALLREPFSAKNKMAMGLFFMLASVLSNRGASALLAYRLRTGQRTFWGVVGRIFGLPDFGTN